MTARRLSWVTVASLVVLALALGARSDGGTPSVADRTARIADELRCPVCQGLSVQDSDSPTARSIRDDIQVRLRRGESDAQVRQAYVDSYGEWILLRPASDGFGALVWAVPAAAFVVGAGGLALALRRWRRSQAGCADGDDRRLVERALGRPLAP